MEVVTTTSHSPEGTASSDLPKKRKAEDLARNDSPEQGEIENGKLRFQVGQKVICNLSRKRSGFVWKSGRIALRWHKLDATTTVPYVVELDDGNRAGCPEDDDECIRLAARATL